MDLMKFVLVVLGVVVVIAVALKVWHQDRHVFYVTDPPFNAKFDGETDDAAAIQAAITAASKSGGTVVFPKGRIGKVGVPITFGDDKR